MIAIIAVVLLATTHLLPRALADLGLAPFAPLDYIITGVEVSALWALLGVALWRLRFTVDGARIAHGYRVAGVTACAAGAAFNALRPICRLMLPLDKIPALDVGLCTQAGMPMAWATPIVAAAVAALLAAALR